MEGLYIKADLSNYSEVISRDRPIERSIEDIEKDEFKIYWQFKEKDENGHWKQRIKKIQWYLQEGNKLSCEEILMDGF